MKLIIRAIQMQPQEGRGDINYLIFEQGKIATPLIVLTDFAFADFIVQANNELKAVETWKKG